jgi:NSS family neurotransmitter:Na+ symporter
MALKVLRSSTISPMPSDNASREYFGSKVGFVLAAAGSAVGLGNMWRFPYQAAEGGGAAFVVLYILMTFLIGVPIMTSEFIIGRSTKRSPIGAFRFVGGSRWVPVGYLVVFAPFIILVYFSVISGWTLRYAIDAIAGFSLEPAARFAEVSSGTPAIVYHLVLMAVTIAVVMRGVRAGIERAALIMMPVLLVLIIALVAWATTLPDSALGYHFYLSPSFDDLLDLSVIKQAAAQAFLSLSVGMGVMITYASYLDRGNDLTQEAITVSMLDFSVAFLGGLIVFPVIFALGLSEQLGESTIGALFISIPAAFIEMGAIGQVVGFVFFSTLLLAALTSSFSLLEVVVASLMDEARLSRKKSALLAGSVAAVAGILPASSQSALGIMDKLAGEIFVVTGALGCVLLVGWVMKDPLSELVKGASGFFARAAPGLLFVIRYLVPAFVAFVLLSSISSL